MLNLIFYLSYLLQVDLSEFLEDILEFGFWAIIIILIVVVLLIVWIVRKVKSAKRKYRRDEY